MEDGCSINLRAAELGLVNQAFARSVDESEQEAQSSAFDRPLLATKLNSMKDQKCFEQAAENNRCTINELQPDGSLKPGGDVSQSLRAREVHLMEFSREASLSSPQLEESIQARHNNNQVAEEKNDMEAADGLMCETGLSDGFRYGFKHANDDVDAFVEDQGGSKRVKEDGTGIDMAYGRDLSGGDMSGAPGPTLPGVHGPIMPGMESGFLDSSHEDKEIAELDISMKSDGTEFYYTPVVSPSVSPPVNTSLVKRSDNRVTFDEASIEIAQDSLETSEVAAVRRGSESNYDNEEEVRHFLDQQFLKNLVDPMQEYFVCILRISYLFRVYVVSLYV